jgi:hypothetical protein
VVYNVHLRDGVFHMRDFIKSVNSYSLAMFCFGLKQAQNMLAPAGEGQNSSPATEAMNAVTAATEEQFGSTLDSTFKTLDALQRWTTDITLFLMFPIITVLTDSSTAEREPRKPRSSAYSERHARTSEFPSRARA